MPRKDQYHDRQTNGRTDKVNWMVALLLKKSNLPNKYGSKKCGWEKFIAKGSKSSTCKYYVCVNFVKEFDMKNWCLLDGKKGYWSFVTKVNLRGLVEIWLYKIRQLIEIGYVWVRRVRKNMIGGRPKRCAGFDTIIHVPYFRIQQERKRSLPLF